MGSFAEMKNAKRGYTSNRLVEGDYLARIDSCEHFMASQSGEKYKVTLTILSVLSGDHREGEVVTTTFSRNHGLGVYLSNIKTFIAGVLGCSDDQVDEAVTHRTCSTFLHPDTGQPTPGENMLSGLVTRVTAVELTSKKKDEQGNPFAYSKYGWSPCLSKEEIQEQLGEERVKRFFPNGL